MNATHEDNVTCTPGPAQTDGALRARICAEYRELPGMRLTLPQAARLFSVEPARCARVLTALVAEGVLWTDGHEFFSAGAGRRTA